MLKKILKHLKKEINGAPFFYGALGGLLIVSFIIRVYRTEDLLRFYYDQGRDALIIWRLWNEGKLFLTGPVTGLPGIFLGPAYYYLIAFFYLLGGGNPVYPSVLLSFLSVLALVVIYALGKEMHSKTAGFFAVMIGGFSYYIFTHSRWLSNPNPILLSSLLFLYSMWRVMYKNEKKWWLGIVFFAGLSLQFEAASGVFYLPTIVVFALWQHKIIPKGRHLLIPLGVFFFTVLPQILFSLRHDNILIKNLTDLFFQEKAFKGVTKFILMTRIDYFWDTFTNKLYPGWYLHAIVFVFVSISAVYVSRKHLKKGVLKLFLIFLLTPIVFYTFFQGNHGNIYDYYMSGYYLPFILFFSLGLAELFSTKIGKIVVLAFFITFFQLNGKLIYNYLTATERERPISFEEQLKAVDWIFEDVKEKGYGEFNVDIYVPPVIPYAYDYLLLWKGQKRCGSDLCGLVKYQVDDLYTLYEQDPPHPERLFSWLERQRGIGKIEREIKFGQITVQKRIRI